MTEIITVFRTEDTIKENNSKLFEAIEALLKAENEHEAKMQFILIKKYIDQKAQLCCTSHAYAVKTKIITDVCDKYPTIIPILTKAEIYNPTSALQFFASHGQVDFVKLLLGKGINPNKYEHEELWPLDHAILSLTKLKDSDKKKETNYQEIISLLLAKGARFSNKNEILPQEMMKRLAEKYSNFTERLEPSVTSYSFLRMNVKPNRSSQNASKIELKKR